MPGVQDPADRDIRPTKSVGSTNLVGSTNFVVQVSIPADGMVSLRLGGQGYPPYSFLDSPKLGIMHDFLTGRQNPVNYGTTANAKRCSSFTSLKNEK